MNDSDRTNFGRDLLEMVESLYDSVERAGGGRRAFRPDKLETMSAMDLINVLCTNGVRFPVKETAEDEPKVMPKPALIDPNEWFYKQRRNPASDYECSHGAGRKMGRKEAARRFTVEDLAAQTSGISCRKDASVLDEIPAAYKDIDQVMENQMDLVEVVHTLRQVVCVKGA